MNNITISQATLFDLENLATLFDAYRVFYNKESDYEGAKQFLADRISQKESVIFIGKKEEKLIGFVQLYPIFSSTRMNRLWLLNDLFVGQEFRGQGISKALIKECKKYSIDTNACGLMLETAKDNLIGNNLYLKTQFQLIEDCNYYFFNH